MNNNLLLHVIIIIHMCIWLYVLFGGFISYNNNHIIMYYALPFIYLIYILPFHILGESEYYFSNKINNENNENENENIKDVNKLSFDDKYEICQNGFLNKNKNNIGLIEKTQNMYILPKLMITLRNINKQAFQNPFSPQGLVVLSFIINIYLLKYKYKIE